MIVEKRSYDIVIMEDMTLPPMSKTEFEIDPAGMQELVRNPDYAAGRPVEWVVKVTIRSLTTFQVIESKHRKIAFIPKTGKKIDAKLQRLIRAEAEVIGAFQNMHGLHVGEVAELTHLKNVLAFLASNADAEPLLRNAGRKAYDALSDNRGLAYTERMALDRLLAALDDKAEPKDWLGERNA